MKHAETLKLFLPWLHWILIGCGVIILLLHFLLHLTSNYTLIVALLLEIAGIVLYMRKIRLY